MWLIHVCVLQIINVETLAGELAAISLNRTSGSLGEVLVGWPEWCQEAKCSNRLCESIRTTYLIVLSKRTAGSILLYRPANKIYGSVIWESNRISAIKYYFWRSLPMYCPLRAMVHMFVSCVSHYSYNQGPYFLDNQMCSQNLTRPLTSR